MSAATHRFYQVIIGTEILNRRRQDKHFDFLSTQLLDAGHELYASLVIKDDPALIRATFKQIAEYEESILFCFGGIGSTPDDLTRPLASEVFCDSKLLMHEEAQKIILEQFGDEAYPHRINMAMLPPNAGLLPNPVNRVPGFSIQERFFFVPGFPKMAHPMVETVIREKFRLERKPTRLTLTAHCSENNLIDLMQKVPGSVEVSSLPAFVGNKRLTVLSLISQDDTACRQWYDTFTAFLQRKNIPFMQGDQIKTKSFRTDT